MSQLDELYTKWKAKPGSKTLTPLVTELNPLIDKAMRSYGLSKSPGLKTRAQLHVIKVLPGYDPKRAGLKTFVTGELQRLRRIGAQQEFAIPIPEQAAIDLKGVRRQEKELTYSLGRDPTPQELADVTRLSPRRIATIKRKYGAPVVSESMFRSQEGEVNTPGVTTGLNPDNLWVDAVYDTLDPIDKKIVDWTLGRSGEPTLTKTQIAAKLGMSVSAITQRAARVARKLEEGSEYRVI